MLRTFLILIACAFTSYARQEDRPVIPEGIKYRFVDDEENVAAREFIAAQFLQGAAGVTKLFVMECTSAPGHWRLVAGAGVTSPLIRKFSIPNERTGKTYVLDGAQLQAASDLRVVGRHLASEVGSEPKVRRLTTKEIARLWVVIPFDIEEPLFIVESPTRQFVLCLKRGEGSKWRVWWIDALSEYDYGK